jgi:hypothetical protein
MKKEITFEKFNYYLIQVDIFKNNLNLLSYTDNRCTSKKDLLIESKDIGLYWGG